jgi:hypothetical protein
LLAWRAVAEYCFIVNDNQRCSLPVTTKVSATLDPTRYKTGIPAASSGNIFISGLQEQVTRLGNDWQTKLGFWKFGVNLVQKLEQERCSMPEPEFERAYVSLILLLLTLGQGLLEEIKDSEIADHLKANLENLNSKYITFKMPPLETKTNRLLDRITA